MLVTPQQLVDVFVLPVPLRMRAFSGNRRNPGARRFGPLYDGLIVHGLQFQYTGEAGALGRPRSLTK